MAGKAKFDKEAAFKSIIGAGASEGSEKPAAKGRPKAEWENKEAHKKACEHWNEGGLAKVWIDKDGYLCIEYESGEWWHYNDKGEWW